MMGQIVLEHVTKLYQVNDGEAAGLLDLSCSIGQAELLGVVGPSGCGKSTLINLIAGFVPCDSGHIVVSGNSVERPGRDRVVVFQDHNLFDWKTARENVEFGLKAAGMPSRQRTERARQYLDLVQLSPFADYYPYQLSGGMKQRVALARALAVEPECILMDEPFGSLDSQLRRELQDDLQHLWQQTRQTIILVTHDLGEAVYLSDRVLVLTGRPGRIRVLLNIELPRPRTPESRDSALFISSRQDVSRWLASDGIFRG